MLIQEKRLVLAELVSGIRELLAVLAELVNGVREVPVLVEREREQSILLIELVRGVRQVPVLLEGAPACAAKPPKHQQPSQVCEHRLKVRKCWLSASMSKTFP